MLFLVISTPRPERPSTVARKREEYWRWMAPKLRSRRCRFVYARAGRGAVALFDVRRNEELHALLNEWAELIPAHFEVLPLIDPDAARQYLKKKKSRRGA